MRKPMSLGVLALSLLALPALAQQAPSGAVVSASEPGKAAAAATVKASAVVTAIDKATRTVTLKGPKGQSFDLVAGEEVRNFDQLKVGDEVVAEYVRAISLQLSKGGGTGDVKETTGAVRAKPGATPGGAVGRRVTAVAEVVDVNPKNNTITLKGPKGNVVDLDVKNPDQFKVVKKGDKVDVEYVEALAVTVQPAKKKDAKSK